MQACPYCGEKNPVTEEVDKEDHVFPVTFGHSGDKKHDVRPWGSYIVLLDEPSVKVKKITVKPKQRLSLQLHTKREELWKIISGFGVMRVGHREFDIKAGDQVEIHNYQVHRVENSGEENLIFIEVQTGVCQEDDIIRIQDDYDRS
jgi:mannose-6-phosphate isomerase-like protein (cupin superfamily)